MVVVTGRVSLLSSGLFPSLLLLIAVAVCFPFLSCSASFLLSWSASSRATRSLHCISSSRMDSCSAFSVSVLGT